MCTGFNADFDGDQMGVYLPLYKKSQLELKTMMRSINNIISPGSGDLILKHTQDIVIGCFYLTILIKNTKKIIKKWFSTELNALNAFFQKQIDIHTPILVRYISLDYMFEKTNNKLYFLGINNIFINKKIEIIVFKYYKNNNSYYLLTNIGILILQLNIKNILILTDFFLETSPGRLLFSMHFKNNN